MTQLTAAQTKKIRRLYLTTTLSLTQIAERTDCSKEKVWARVRALPRPEHRPPVHVMSPEMRAQAQAMRDEGHSVRAISLRLGFARATVEKHTSGLRRSAFYGTPEEKDRAQELYDGGMAALQVAAQLNRNPGTIHQWLDPARMRIARSMSPQQRRELQRRYDQGRTVAELSVEYGRSVTFIESWLDKARMRPRGKRPIDRARVMQLHAKGHSAKEIARTLGCNQATVSACIVRFAPKDETA